MNTKGTIQKEIVELMCVKSAYNHYLVSYHSFLNVENTTIVKDNLMILEKSLSYLQQLLRLQNTRDNDGISLITPQAYKWSTAEDSAIMHFNADKRFIITE